MKLSTDYVIRFFKVLKIPNPVYHHDLLQDARYIRVGVLHDVITCEISDRNLARVARTLRAWSIRNGYDLE